ncbi:serine/arginine repetitive matrix protein 2-like isoform X4 [Lineus longissimus]|uniref:serine/arginine repetitive matrix protein 2-like isoform X4 n=1 Tax=Lineus longissimus TaxID=88925 RepID=UPI00315D60B0
MFKATYNLTFGTNKVGDTLANGIPGQHISGMPNTKVSMRSGGRNILQIQGRPRSLDSGYPPDYNAKPRPFLAPHGGDSSDNQGVRPVLPLTQPSGDQGAAFNKSPRPFRKTGDDGTQTPRATSYPSYPTHKKLGDPGRSYLPERKNVGTSSAQPTWGQRDRRHGPPSGSSADHLGSDLNRQGMRDRSAEKSPGPDMIHQPPRSPLNRELSPGSPKPPWSPNARESSPLRPPPPRSPRRKDPSPDSPKPPWYPAERGPRERSPKKEQPLAKSSAGRDTKERSPTKDPPWSKPREPSPKEALSLRSKYGRGTSPAKENRPPWSAGSRDNRDKSPSKDPRPPWSAGARDVSPKERRPSAGRGQSPGKEHASVVRDPSPRGRRPQWPNDPRDPSPSKEQRSPGGRGLSPKKDKQQWSPGGRGSSPVKEQRPPWSPGGRVTSPVKDVRPPWMIQAQGKDDRVDKPRSRGTSPSKDYKPPWAQPSHDKSPGLSAPVSHQPPKSPRTRGQSPARSNQVRDFRGQSPARHEKPQWSYPGERDSSPQEQKKRYQSGRAQSPAQLPPVGQSSPRMSRSQRTKDVQEERTRKSPQIVSPKRSPPQKSFYRHDEHDRRISPQRVMHAYTHPPERASYIMQEPEHASRGQPQYSSDEKQADEQSRRGRERSRREQPRSPRAAKKDIRQGLMDESNLDDSLSERDDEVERILSGILDTTAMSQKERKAGFQSQDQIRSQGQGHAFEPYNRQDSSDSKSSQPHSNFYQSLQVRPDVGQISRQHVPSSQQSTAPLSASEPKKILLKSASNPDPVSFASVDADQVAPSSPKEQQQSPRTRRSAFARSKTYQAEIASDHEVTETAVAERKRSLELQIKSSHSFDSLSCEPLSVHQSEGESAPPKVPLAYKPGATVTFINGVPCEAKATPVKSPRVRRQRDQQRQRAKSLDSEVYRERIKGQESAGEEAYQSDSKVSDSNDRSRQNTQDQSDSNRYSGTYDNVHGSDYKAPSVASDKTDGGSHRLIAPPVASDSTEGAQRLSESFGNPAVFVEQSYRDSRDEVGHDGSFSHLQPPEEALSRTSPSVREMAMERESAEAAFQQEEQHVRKKKPYSSRKMSMPVQSRAEKIAVRKLSLEAAADLPSGSDTEERSSRATPIQPQVQDLMAFRMRPSKFRHVFGEAYKKDKSYENVRITKNQHDSMFCAVNPKFVAVVVESAGGGAFLVLPIKQVGRIDINAPKVCGHAGAVLDIKWSPFNDHQIASCSDDATIKVWEVPEDGLRENLTEWIVDLHGHQRRIGYIEWHPTAEHILLSAGFDYNVILWNIETAEPINIITCHTDTIFSISWNRNGSLFATTSKDKKIRVIDPRSGSVVSEGPGHVGPKSSKVVFLGDSQRLFTTGFSRMSERQFGIWDMNDLSKPLRLESIDSSSGVLLPYYDVDNKVMFLVGKGDGNIRYYEIVDEAPYCHFLSAYLSGHPQKGFGVMPKRGVDLTKCEIVRFYKLLSSKPLIEPISMRVPRKSEMFQEDIFPPTASSIPSLSAMEWINGQNRDPILVSLKDGAMQPTNTPTITTYKAVSRSLLNNNDTAPPQEPTEANHVPGSVQNIKKLSIGGDTIPNLDEILDGKILYEDDPKRKRESVHERISAFETKAEPIRPSPPPMLANTSPQISIEKKTPPPSHWLSELPPNGLPKSDGEASATAPEDAEMTTTEKRAPPVWMYSAKPFSSQQSTYTVLQPQSPFEEKSIEIIDHTPPLRSTERKRVWSDMSDEYETDISASDITRVRTESVREIIQKVEDDTFSYEPPSPVSKVHVKKVWTPKSPQAEEPPIENGLTPKTDPELRKAYFRQLEEIHSLKEQIMLKDKRIRQLEEELNDLKDCDNDNTPNQSNC